MSEKWKTKEGSTYFVSFAVVNWIDVFTRGEYAKIFTDSMNYCIQNKGLKVHAYVVMPNHVHLIASVKNGTLGLLLRDLKSFTSWKIIEAIRTNKKESRRKWMLEQFALAGSRNPHNPKNQFWQQTNRPIQLHDIWTFERTYAYLLNNPVKAMFVTKPEHYFWCSAHPDQPVEIVSS